MKQEAMLIRNFQDKLLFDVVVIDYAIPQQSEILLQGVSFELGSQYVEDYNKSLNSENN